MKKQNAAAFLLGLGTILILIIVSYQLWDIPLANYSRTLSRSIVDIAEIITVFGIGTWYFVVSVLFFLVFKYIYKNKLYSSQFLFMFCSLSLSGLVLVLIKWIAGRYRPSELFNHGLSGFGYWGAGYDLTSFPSGHTQTIFTMAMVITVLFPRWGIPAFTMAILVGISRLVLTVHYLSDVIGGAGIGILGTLAIKYLFDRYNVKLRK